MHPAWRGRDALCPHGPPGTGATPSWTGTGPTGSWGEGGDPKGTGSAPGPSRSGHAHITLGLQSAVDAKAIFSPPAPFSGPTETPQPWPSQRGGGNGGLGGSGSPAAPEP